MLAIIEQGAEALVWNERAVAHATNSADPSARRWLATLQNNIGWAYAAAGRYADALPAFEAALRLRREQGRPSSIRVARYAVAKTHRLLGRPAEALAEQEAILRECELANEPDGYVYEEVAVCLLALGRAAEARPHFARAYELLSKDPWFPRDEAPRLARMKQLGGLP